MNRFGKISMAVGIAIMSRNVMAQNLSYGLQGGTSFAVQSPIGDIYDNDDVRIGYSFGAFSNYNLTNNVCLQAELNYEQKGSKYQEVTNKYNYLTVPLLVKYKLYDEPETKLIVDFYAGPYVSFLVSANNDFHSAEFENVDVSDNTHNTGMGLAYGFTYRYPIKDDFLRLNLRFGLDLTAYDKKDSDLKNKFMGLSLGYEF